MPRVDNRDDGPAPPPLVQARGLTKTYSRAGQPIEVLRTLDLDVARGEFVAFMGPSGSGKTTLLNLLGGLDHPTSGHIVVGGTDITALSRRALVRWRARHVGYIFQMYNLLPVLSAYRNVELPLLLTRLGRAARRAHVETALRIVGLGDRMRHFPRQLSGGQEQRVAIARAIVTDPAILLCDEPTGDLDRSSADTVLELLSLLASDHGTTVLMVTHDPRAAERAHTVHHLEKGVLVTAPAVEVHA
jgi:putative ABC transport system ATP-binding protein